jgi:hypothetical protein
MLHRYCAKVWYDSKADKHRIPDCPCCQTPIDERPENLNICFFSGNDDSDSKVEPTPPQEVLKSFNPATRQILELLAMLKELRPRLIPTDMHKYDQMIDEVMLDAWLGNPEPSRIREIREKVDKVVEKVGEMWAVEETKVSPRTVRLQSTPC